MPAHVDILDDSERLAKPFWTSVILHVSIAGIILASGKFGLLISHRDLFGDPNGGRAGSVAVNVTSSIPLPAKTGPINPVANDTESQVPTPPPTKAKPQPKAVAKEPEPDAVRLSKKERERLLARAFNERNTFREKQQEKPNQVYGSVGPATSSPMYNLPGGGGVGIGNNSPFGTQFGWYATAIRDKVAQKWQTADVGRTSTPVAVTFTILRDGSVAPGSVKISQPSGNRAFDFSAQRAVLDATPFPPLPGGFPRSEANVEFFFELRR